MFDKFFKIFIDLSHLVRRFKICGRKVIFSLKTTKNFPMSETEIRRRFIKTLGQDEHPVHDKNAHNTMCFVSREKKTVFVSLGNNTVASYTCFTIHSYLFSDKICLGRQHINYHTQCEATYLECY